MTDVAGWLEQHADRVAARQRAQVETAKLLTTFATGVAAALCAAAVQVHGSNRWETASLYGLAVSGALTVLTILLDRLTEAPAATLLSRAHTKGWGEETLLDELRTAQIESVDANRSVVRQVRIAAGVQIVAASAAGVLATVSLQLS